MHDAGHEADFDMLFAYCRDPRLMLPSDDTITCVTEYHYDTNGSHVYKFFGNIHVYRNPADHCKYMSCTPGKLNCVSTGSTASVSKHRSETKRLGCANYHKVLMHSVLRSGTSLSTYT